MKVIGRTRSMSIVVTWLDLQSMETSKQRINVESITKSLSASPLRGDAADGKSSLAILMKSMGTLKRINCSH